MLLPFTRRLSTTSILACCSPSAGELVNCSPSAHSSNDRRASQMQPAVEGREGGISRCGLLQPFLKAT